MDADAYLKRHGWKGTGHALDNHGRGIKKPLLIAHKQDQLGLGQKKAAHRTDDQWWMRAFDESLKNIGTGKESTLSQVRKQGVNRGGLYGFFVKGEGLAGTVSNTEESSAAEASDSSTQKSRASTRATSASESSSDSDSDSDSDTKMTNNKSTTQRVVAVIPDVPTDSKKRKRGEEDTYNEQAAREAFIMKRIFKAVNKEVKKKLPEKHGKEETKESKLLWQKARREARSELKKQLMVDAMMKGELPNPNKYTTKDEALKNYEKDQRAQNKAEREEKKSAEEAKKEAQEQKKADAKLAKMERKKRKLNEAETSDKSVAANLPAPKAERYPNPQEKQEHSLATEDQKTKLEVEQNLPVIAKKIAKLSANERASYQERADLKQQSLELYVLRRIQKKKDKKAENNTKPAPEPSNPFFIDLSGDSNLLKAIPAPANLSLKLTGTTPLSPTTPADPSPWADRPTKDLTKEERSLRRAHMRAQRPCKPAPKEGTKETRRQETKDALVAKLLTEQGLKKGQATEGQKKEARIRARRMMKESERERKEEKIQLGAKRGGGRGRGFWGRRGGGMRGEVVGCGEGLNALRVLDC